MRICCVIYYIDDLLQMVRSKLAAKEGVLEYVVCCAAARCWLRAATNENFAKLNYLRAEGSKPI